jgi:hypothetical protein
MGYPISAFAIDLKKLKPNKSEDFLSEMIEEFEEDFDDNWENFEEQIVREGAPILERALYLLLQGKPLPKEHAFQYGYALEILVKHVGECVNEESLEDFDDMLDPLLKKARCPNTNDMLGRGILPMKMPRPNDWPEIGTITPVGCVAGLGAMATIEPLAKGDDDTLMVIHELRGWFEAAKKKKCGIVWFAY